MPELQEVQVQYKGKVFAVPLEKENCIMLENLKHIDENVVGIVHYNVGDTFRKKVLVNEKGKLLTKDRFFKQIRLVVKDHTTKKTMVIDE